MHLFQDHFLTAMSEVWIWVSSKKMSITQASGIYFSQHPLQRPENDDVIILTPQSRTEWPVWAQMCDLNQLGCVTVASIIKIRVAFVFQPCSECLLAQNNLMNAVHYSASGECSGITVKLSHNFAIEIISTSLIQDFPFHPNRRLETQMSAMKMNNH